MSENKQGSKRPDGFQGRNKGAPGGGGGGFNFYWIYAILGVLLISINLFNWQGGMTQITEQQFFKDLVNKSSVKKIIVVNKTQVEVFLQPDALNDEFNKKRK